MRFARWVIDVLRRDLRRLRHPAVVPVGSLDEVAERLGRPARVGVVRLDGLGDWILTLPLLTALARSTAVAEVTAVAPPGVAAMLSTGGADRVTTLRFSTVPRAAGRPRRLRRELARTAVGQRQAWRDGRGHRDELDVVVVPRWETDIGHNCRAWALATGATLMGHDPSTRSTIRPSERHEGELYALTSVDERPVAHELERLSHLLCALGLDDRISDVFARDYFDVADVTPTPGVITIHTGAGHPNRRWPLDRWAELVDRIVATSDATVQLVGGPEDLAVHDALSERSPRIVSLVTTTTLADLPRILAASGAFVGGDSGPAHLAASLGTPTVVLSPHPVGASIAHVNSPERFAPTGPRVTILRPDGPAGTRCADGCTSSQAHCITAITTESVLAGLEQT